MKSSNFKNIFVPPFPDDSGAGLGAALFVNSLISKNNSQIQFKHNYLGPSYTNNEILTVLRKFKLKYEMIKNISNSASNSIVNGKIIGWFQGSLEFGDRALGNRSILADPRNKLMKDKINKSIKYRENFRPFAPAVLEEKAKEFLKITKKVFLWKKH